MPRHHYGILLLLAVIASLSASAQYTVRGTVFDSSRHFLLESVSVISSSGRGTVTDSAGRYALSVKETDTIWFSYQGKPTPKYPVAKIPDLNQFNIALHLKSDVMAEVKVRSRYYKEDSAMNRKEYAKVFDWRRPSFGSIASGMGPTGASFDLDELIRLFQFRKNRSMERFQERLIQQEQDKFIDHRFSKALVTRITGLKDKDLDLFMVRFRPSYAFTLVSSDYDFHSYIKTCLEQFQKPITTF